jgi:hypothetical protein
VKDRKWEEKEPVRERVPARVIPNRAGVTDSSQTLPLVEEDAPSQTMKKS